MRAHNGQTRELIAQVVSYFCVIYFHSLIAPAELPTPNQTRQRLQCFEGFDFLKTQNLFDTDKIIILFRDNYDLLFFPRSLGLSALIGRVSRSGLPSCCNISMLINGVGWKFVPACICGVGCCGGSSLILHNAFNLLNRASVIADAYTLAVSHSSGRIICGVNALLSTVLNHAYKTRQAVSLVVFGTLTPSTTYINILPLLPGWTWFQ